MRLTRKKAIEIAIELWTWLAKDGSRLKGHWPEWEKYGDMECDCPLCEYNERAMTRRVVFKCGTCPCCPYSEEYGRCVAPGTPYDIWEQAVEEEDCGSAEEAAVEFLGQLKQLV